MKLFARSLGVFVLMAMFAGNIAYAQDPLCDVTCTPDPNASSYSGTVVARPLMQNARGNSSPIVATARLNANAGILSSESTVPGSQSYNYVIPILRIPGRAGTDLSLNLYYNSRIWDVNSANGTATFNADRDFPSYGFRLDFGYLEYDLPTNTYILAQGDGTKHEISGVALMSFDGTLITYNNANGVLTYRNGTMVGFGAVPSQQGQVHPKLFRPYWIKDTNGNMISVEYLAGHDQMISRVINTEGKAIVFNYDASNQLTSLTQTMPSDPGGVRTYATFTWGQLYGNGYHWHNFSGLVVIGAPNWNTALNVLTACKYANNTGYRFTYGDWGIINKIELLSSTGLTRSYTSYNYPAASSSQTDAPTYTQQTVSPDGGTSNLSTWTYASTKVAGVVTSTAITSPNGTINTTNFDPDTGMISSVEVKDGSKVLRTVSYTWTTANASVVLGGVTTTLNDSGQQSSVQYEYDDYLNVATVSEYGFTGNLKRQSVTTFATGPYSTQHIWNLPTQIMIKDGAGNTVARTDLAYDTTSLSPIITGAANHDDTAYGAGLTTRGNLTSVTRYSNAAAGTGAVTRTFNYDSLGNLRVAQVDCCNQKTFNFSSATQYSAPDSIVRGPAGMQFSTSYTYNLDNNLLLTSTDENNQETKYQYDLMNRTTQALLPPQPAPNGLRVQLNTSFDDAAVSPTATSSNTANNAVTVATLDGLGHVMRVDNKNGSTVISSVTNSYDKLWERTQGSNPFAPGDTPINTLFSYDALGRVKQISPPSAGSVQYQYSGTAIIVTDAAGKQRRNVTNSFGQLVEVDEPGVPPASANNHATMQADGNFILYNPSNAALWSTGTAGQNGSTIEIQDDGNFVLYSLKWLAGTYAAPSPGPFPPQTCSIGHELNTGQTLPSGKCITSPAGQYMLYMAPDGNLYIYDIAHSVGTWGPGTQGHPGAYAIMQSDGNFVVYTSTGVALWSSGTNGTAAERLEMENDGRILIFKSVWNSGTAQSPLPQTQTPPSCNVGTGAGTTGVLNTSQCFVSFNGLYEVLLQTDGNLVLYNLAVSPAQALWSTNTGLTPFSPGITFATTYTYDVTGNLTTVSQAAGPVNGQQVAGQARGYAYDGLGRVTSVTTPESGTVTTYYTTAGGGTCSGDSSLPCRIQDARGVVRTFTYDAINRPTGVTYSDNTPPVTSTYDTGGAAAFALDRLTKITEGPTNSQTFTYDNFGRIKKVSHVIDTTTYPVQYAYNLASEVTSITYPSNRVILQNYDAIGRLCAVGASGSTCTSGTTYLNGLTYNAAGEALGLTTGNGVQGTFSYNDHLQSSTLRYFKGSTDILNLAYDYNTGVPGNNGQIQAVHYYTSPGVEDLTKSENFTYDSLGRLGAAHTTTVNSTLGTWSLQWGYDRLGNRTSQTLVGGNVTIGQPNFVIDPATNRIVGYCYDAAGNLLDQATCPAGSHQYTYDGANRVTKINTGPPTYTYFGALRIKKVIGSPTTTTVYIYSGSKPIAEYVNGAAVTAPSTEYVYAGSNLLVTISGGSTTYHHPDHLSNRAETNSSGTRTRTFGAFPFGETWYETGTADKWKFTSYESDCGTGETGLNYAQFRYHAAGQGRFMSVDPMSGNLLNPQSLNGYAYVTNDPVNLIDPLGLAPCNMTILARGASFSNDQLTAMTNELNRIFGTGSIDIAAIHVNILTSGQADYTMDVNPNPARGTETSVGVTLPENTPGNSSQLYTYRINALAPTPLKPGNGILFARVFAHEMASHGMLGYHHSDPGDASRGFLADHAGAMGGRQFFNFGAAGDQAFSLSLSQGLMLHLLCNSRTHPIPLIDPIQTNYIPPYAIAPTWDEFDWLFRLFTTEVKPEKPPEIICCFN